MKILSIETSCDETAIATLEIERNGDGSTHYTVLANALLSQAKDHARYGGVFPNLAKREHGRNLTPVLMEALRQSHALEGKTGQVPEEEIMALKEMLAREEEMWLYLSEFLRANPIPSFDCIAVTVGPGLEPALWVGINFARALSAVWKIPVVPVNHMEGHIMMARAVGNDRGKNGTIALSTYPTLALLVSGGHTELVLMKEQLAYEIIGETRDDAAGEAFDKCARLLGLSYPGGPEIAHLAAEARLGNITTSDVVILPRPMLKDDSFDFSFSGLKTAVKNAVAKEDPLSDEKKKLFAREIEDAIVEVLVEKTMRAVEEYGVHIIIVGGGVSANTHLRTSMNDAAKKLDAEVLFPPPELSTDNAIMIALAGFARAEKKEFAASETLTAQGQLKIA